MEKTKAASNPLTLKSKTAQRAWKFIHDMNSAESSRLNKLAIIDGDNKYTYGLMFRQWERYASVFSALNMTEENHSRVGLVGSFSAEVIFAFYGLNMVGAQVSVISMLGTLQSSKLINTIKEEKLTDFIITDDFAQPNVINELLQRQKDLGLNNIIIMHIPLTGPTINNALSAAQEFRYWYYKSMYAPICMDTLLDTYANYPVTYTSDEDGEIAAIIHTSGTTSGTGKPVPISDKALNNLCVSFYQIPNYDFLRTDLVCGLMVDLSNAYGLCNQVHLPFALGGTVVIVPGGVLNPNFYKAIAENRFTLLFCIAAMFEAWLKMPKTDKFDFSSLKGVVIGGTSVSPKDKKRYYEFMREHGLGDVPFVNGYGISELGGSCTLSTEDLDDNSIGYLLPGFDMRVYDEEADRFYTVKDAPCEGVLYLNSGSMANSFLDDKEIVKTQVINNKRFLCTNDAVKLEPDGKLTYLGRANRYFINEEGKKYESGKVETEVARQSGIESCVVVPVYIKTRHDNIPMLCVSTLETGEPAPDIVKNALLNIFKTEKTLSLDQMPHRVLIAGELPRNGNGKIDIYKISNGAVIGDRYRIKPSIKNEKLSGIKLVLLKEDSDDMVKEVMSGIKEDLKDKFTFNPFNSKEEEDTMKVKDSLFKGFNAMNMMGVHMMKNFQQAQQAQNNPFASQMQQMIQWYNYSQELNQWALQVGKQLYDYNAAKIKDAEAFQAQIMNKVFEGFQQAANAAQAAAQQAQAEASEDAEVEEAEVTEEEE